MKTKMTIAIILSTQLLGCSAYKAISQDAPADLQGLGVGVHRQEIIGRLGAPKMIDTLQDGTKQDIFEFTSGANQGTKARAILYVGAGLFTAGLSELIFWPLEMSVFEAAKCTALATYDKNLKTTTWSVNDKNGMSAQGC